MNRLGPACGIFFAMTSASASADRPLTEGERARLEAAVAAQGCSGGKLEFDDGRYEADDVRCDDGKTYDLKFDADFSLLRKKPER